MIFLSISICEVGFATERLDKFDISNPWQSLSNPQISKVEMYQMPQVREIKESNIKINIRQLRIIGQGIYSEPALVALVQDTVGREVTLSEIQNIAGEITQYYRRQGYLVARAYLPAQEIKDGVIDIRVLLGHYGKIVLHNQVGIAQETVQNMISGIKSGDTIEKKKLDRSILLLSDIPGIKVKAVLSPGELVGTSDLNVTVDNDSLITGSVSINNYGSPYIGRNQISLGFNLNHPTGQGDVLSVNTMMPGHGLRNTDIAYQIPIEGSGLKMGVGYSKMHYDLGEEFASLLADGQVKTGNLFISYPFVRSYRSNVYGQISYQKKEIQDRIGAIQSVTEKDERDIVIGVSGDNWDSIGYGGMTNYSLTYSTGSLNIQSLDAKAIDDLTARTNGKYGKYNLKIVRQQGLRDNLSLYLSLSSQLATNNLDSSEKMSLGGAYGVRAYPQGEAMGDEGYLFTAEVRHALPVRNIPGSLQIASFFDTGSILVNKKPWLATANRRTLSGAGIGLIWNKDREFYIRMDYAWKLRGEKSTAQADEPSRLWLQGIQYF